MSKKETEGSLLAAVGYLDETERLLAAGADTEERDERGMTALLKSAERGAGKCVEALLRKGADVSARNKNGSGALLLATESRSPGRTAIVKLLIAAGADVRKTNKAGVSPLENAAATRNDEAVRLLIEAEASSDGAADKAVSALLRNGPGKSRAELARAAECLRLLMENGAARPKAEQMSEQEWPEEAAMVLRAVAEDFELSAETKAAKEVHRRRGP